MSTNGSSAVTSPPMAPRRSLTLTEYEMTNPNRSLSFSSASRVEEARKVSSPLS